MHDKKNYIIVKDRHPYISEILNDCVDLCVPTYKKESLASILKKICARITTLQADVDQVVASDGVQSVGLSDISNFALATGSPITDSGTLGYDLVAQQANYVFAGPESGANAIPTFRLLVPDDIPPLPYISSVNGLISGGIITWVSGYTYDVSPASYTIGGTTYNSPYTQITLDPADLVLDRIDVVAVDNTGNVVVITGVPAIDPQAPSIDPSTQLALSFILVKANTIAPVIPQEWIYQENIEWTTAPSAGTINPASTNNPASGLLDVEATAALNGTFIDFTAPVAPDMSLYNILKFKIRAKAGWGVSSITFRFYTGATPIGGPVALAGGTYGFDILNTTTYQNISIPLSIFGVLTGADKLRITVNTTTSLGFYIDDIEIQAGPSSGADADFHRQGGNTRGTTSILGTNDLQDLNIITNNVKRIGVLKTGTVLVNKPLATTLTGSGSTPFLQVSGKSMFDKIITGTTTVEAGSISNALDIYGNTFIGGTLPFITWTNQTLTLNGLSSSGRLLLTAQGTGSAFQINHDRAEGSMLLLRNVTNSETAGMRFAHKTNNTIGAAFPSLVTPFGYYSGVNITHSISSWSNTNATRNSYMDFYPMITGTATSLIRVSAIATDPASPTTSKEIEHITYEARFLSPFSTHRIVIGSTTDDGTTSLQTTGSIKFNGLSTDNTGTQVLTKTAAGLNAWRDVSSISGGGGETLQQVITNGATLTGNNTIAGGGFDLNILNSDLTLQSTGSNSITLQNGIGNLVLEALAGDLLLAAPSGVIYVDNQLETADIVIRAGNRIRVGSNASDLTLPSNGDIFYNSTTNKFRAYENGSWVNMIGGGAGETNTASNLGGGLANYSTKVGVDLQFNSFNATDFDLASNLISIDYTNGQAASGSTKGFLTSTDWTTFNNKISAITGDSGVTNNTATNIQLGGPLLQNATISGSTSYALTITGDYASGIHDGVLIVENAGLFGRAIYGHSTDLTGGTGVFGISDGTSGTGVVGSGTDGNGVYGSATGGIGVRADSNNVALLATTTDGDVAGSLVHHTTSDNNVETILSLTHTTFGTAGNGIGGAIEYIQQVSSGDQRVSNQLISRFTNATLGSQVSQFIVTGVDNAVTADLFTLSGSGALQLNKYGINTFAGTPAYALGVDASGNVVEFTPATGGGDALTANPLSQFAATTSAQLAGVISDETGTGLLVFATSPIFTTPRLNSSSTVGHVWTATDTSGNGSFQAPTGGSYTETETAIASDTTPNPTGDSRVNYYDLTALAGGATFAAPSGTPANHNRLTVRILDDGTARSLAWNAIYRGGSTVVLPSTTIVNETMYVEFIYNSASSTWDCIGVALGY